MAKFNSNSRSAGSRGEKKSFKPFTKGENTGGDKEKSGYKAKRSFTKNKDFREKDPGKFGDKSKRSFGSDEKKSYPRPFEKKYGTGSKSFGDKPKRSFSNSDDKKPFKKEFGSREKSFGDKPFNKSKNSFEKSEDRTAFKKEFSSREKSFDKPYEKKFDGDRPKRSFSNSDDKKPFKKEFGSREKSFDKPYEKKFDSNKSFDDKPKRSFSNSDDDKPFKKEFVSREKSFDKDKTFSDKPRRSSTSKTHNTSSFAKTFGKKTSGADKSENKSYTPDGKPRRKFKPRGEELETNKRVKYDEFEEGKTFSNSKKQFDDYKSEPKTKSSATKLNKDGLTRLNKYLSNAGIASRRDADTLIASGVVKVNGVPITEMGYKVKPGDSVTYGDSRIKSERKVYLLLNKPKDYITTMDDPQERKTVMELINGACKERLYPVGRLDRNTTGLLLFTNDGEVTAKLTHPKHNIKKIYHVTLNKGLKTDDFNTIKEGLELEDGFIKADDIAYVGEGKKDVGIEIHSGRNRIVRRIFEQLGYEILKLDRVVFAGLTKKDLPRSKHRFLTAKEISFLQMIG
jgi:23S rRNA pseudouridine2605 synthase